MKSQSGSCNCWKCVCVCVVLLSASAPSLPLTSVSGICPQCVRAAEDVNRTSSLRGNAAKAAKYQLIATLLRHKEASVCVCVCDLN